MNTSTARTLYDLVESNERKLDVIGLRINDALQREARLQRKLKLATGALATTREMLDASQELLQRVVNGIPVTCVKPFIDRLATHYNSLQQVTSELDLSVD